MISAIAADLRVELSDRQPLSSPMRVCFLAVSAGTHAVASVLSFLQKKVDFTDFPGMAWRPEIVRLVDACFAPGDVVRLPQAGLAAASDGFKPTMSFLQHQDDKLCPLYSCLGLDAAVSAHHRIGIILTWLQVDSRVLSALVIGWTGHGFGLSMLAWAWRSGIEAPMPAELLRLRWDCCPPRG